MSCQIKKLFWRQNSDDFIGKALFSKATIHTISMEINTDGLYFTFCCVKLKEKEDKKVLKVLRFSQSDLP